MKKIIYLIFISTLFFACNSSKKQVDLFVKNANIYTVNQDFDIATAFVVKDGKIVEVGETSDLEKKYNAKEVFDAEGKTIVPGLIDAHAHLYGLGLSMQSVDLTGAKSIEEALLRIVDFQKTHQMEFISGRGWDQNLWKEKEFPTKEALDSLFPDTPIALRRIDGHALWVNSKALELAQITAETKVQGGEIILKNNEPSGILIDNPMELVNKIIPKTSRKNTIQALLDAEQKALSYGLTTIDDAGLDKEIIELIDSLQKTGDFHLRIYAMVSNTASNRDYYLKKGIYKTDFLNVRSFKVYTDGALGSRGAALREEYSDQHNHFGAMITTADSLDYYAQLFLQAGFQMNSHAIGDSATISVLRVYKKTLENSPNQRWRVEHAQIISPEAFDYFSTNILPSVQPTHATSDMYWAEERLGKKRIQNAYTYHSLLKKSGILPLGTDFPIEHVNPIYTFFSAVFRKDLHFWPDNGFQSNEALSREDALRGMTIWAAFSNFEENEKGSLENGKFADFTVLDTDIMKADEKDIPKTKVVATFINGKKIYSNN
ncbi:MAG: amidohydrolase [Weeksellaceae bacterium]|jgi:predicted amidohydrolase YtcJ|nr:amidohydrolase [Weeksellaceae bacterium]